MGSNKAPNLTGLKVDRLTVIRFSENKRGAGGYYWVCKCKCGNEVIVRATLLIQKKTRSCGCYARELLSKRQMKHGKGRTPTAALWRSMVARCHNPKHKSYKSYGKRGIKVCSRWRDNFLSFLEDMGEKPEGKQLNRIDNDGPYSPDNCEWTDSQSNNRNRRDNILLTYKGETKLLVEWAEELKIPYYILWTRHSKGWSDKKTLTQPVRKITRKT